MRLLVVSVPIWAILLWACAGGSEPEPTTGDSFTVPSRGDPAKSIAPARTLTGVLGFDEIEGGCGFIEAADGTRYEVVYPADWTLDRAAFELRGPDAVVTAGDLIEVRGAVATDRSSVCQIGPIFVASEVAVPPR
jgi:hypothetical protein